MIDDCSLGSIRSLIFNTANANVIDFIASLEVALTRATMTEGEKLAIQHKVTTLLMNTTKQPRLLTAELHAIKQINSDETIIYRYTRQGCIH